MFQAYLHLGFFFILQFNMKGIWVFWVSLVLRKQIASAKVGVVDIAVQSDETFLKAICLQSFDGSPLCHAVRSWPGPRLNERSLLSFGFCLCEIAQVVEAIDGRGHIKRLF